MNSATNAVSDTASDAFPESMPAACAKTWLRVCALEHLIANSGVAALVEGRQVAIFYLPEEPQAVFAIDNHDPFSTANVMSRGVVGDLKGQLVVAAPIYKQHFNLQTGVCLEKPEVSLATWPVKIENDQVLIWI